MLEYGLRFLAGGSQCLRSRRLATSLRPKSFAGLFGAAPSIALATLLITLSDKRRLDVVERDQVSGRRSIGLGVADEFGHAGFNPPIVRDFQTRPGSAGKGLG